MKKLYLFFVVPILVALACNSPAQSISTATQAATPASATQPLSPTETLTLTTQPTETAIPSVTPTFTLTPTITDTPGPSATPTFAFPAVTVNKQAHCRYGPSQAYLHAADLYSGDTGTVRGRFVYSKWLYVKFDKLDYLCWVAPSVVDVVGDISKIGYKELNLQSIGSNQYGPPKNAFAVRDGDQVTISWDRVEMTQDKDRGYLLELFVAFVQAYIFTMLSSLFIGQGLAHHGHDEEHDHGHAEPGMGSADSHGSHVAGTAPGHG